MLQLARLDPESDLPNPQPVNLSKLSEAVCAELGHQILAKNIDFELNAENNCIVQGQSEWLRVLIRNLVDNAIRYTPEMGTVRVNVSTTDTTCRMSVSDSGPGIPATERATVLQRFHRLQHHEQTGSGLGLAIVARIAELHGVQLVLEEAKTGGLEVTVLWPLA
jgi:two-component system sensor histidine kinase QseC